MSQLLRNADLYIALVLVGRLPDVWAVLSLLTCLTIIPLVNAIQFISDKTPDVKKNYKWGAGEIITVIAGTIIWILLILSRVPLPSMTN